VQVIGASGGAPQPEMGDYPRGPAHARCGGASPPGPARAMTLTWRTMRSWQALIPLVAAAALAASIPSGCVPGIGPAGQGAFEPDSVPDAYARPTAALMWPDATRAFQVTPAGDLYNGAWTVAIRPSADGEPAAGPRVIAYERRWMPVAVWTRRGGDLEWRFSAVALPEPAPRDSGLLVSLRIEVANRGAIERSARLSLELGPPPDDPVFVAFDAPEAAAPRLRWGTGAGRDTVEGWCQETPGGAVCERTWKLPPRATRSLRVVLPAYPTPEGSLARWARVPHVARLAEARAHWTAEIERSTRFDLGDPEVEDALRAAEVVLLCCRERRGDRWVPIGGPFQYRDVWLRDGARLIHALGLLGRTDEARELAEGLAAFQWPQGPFLSQRGQLDGTGQALWAFEQAYLRPGAGPDAAPVTDAARRAWRWCEEQRRVGSASGMRFGPMLPFGEPRDGELVRAQLVGNDAWAIAGYRAAARLLRAGGRVDSAIAVERARSAYLGDFERALGRTRSRDLPPSWQEIGLDWGNLAVAWPCDALPASDPRCAALARRVWAVVGGAGLCSYATPDSLHYYLGADLGTWALLAGRRAAADSVLAAMLHWRSASGAAGEIFSARSRDYGRNLPPHPTSAAALVTLVRHALIFDEGDTLRLTLGARERWWRGAKVRGAPTRWGTIDLEFGMKGDRAEWRWTPVRAWTALTLPPGAIAAGAPPAPLVAGGAPGVVLAPPGVSSAAVTLRAAAGAEP